MSYDVVVVGGGMGGLTAAALLAARGLSVCLLERQSQVGGCIGRVEFSGYDFDPGMGLYTSFGEGEFYERLFDELRVVAPAAIPVESPYVVRLASDTDVNLYRTDVQFWAELERVFPECGDDAIDFYKKVNAALTLPAQNERKGLRKLFSSRADGLAQLRTQVASTQLDKTSDRFRRFVDAQLRAFLQTSLERCDFLSACKALSLVRQQLYAIAGGPASLAEKLAEALKLSGGGIRLNSPVLRLAYDESGKAVGVDLLSGETVHAKKAIISNMTVWDTYGKLVGLNRTPPEVKSKLNALQNEGAYLLYATIETQALERLPGANFLIAGSQLDDDEVLSSELAVSIRAEIVDGKHAVTVKASTEVSSWFAFQSSEEDYEEWDQAALELLWSKLHVALPELGDSIEVIETASPRTCYDQTRRKLGMVMGVERTVGRHLVEHSTSIPNLFIVGDTVTSSPNLTEVAQSALQLVNQITK